MKKYLALAGGAVALGAIGWGALWYAGRGSVEEAIALEIEALERDGVSVEIASQSIGGFPFSYVVTAREVTVRGASGAVLELPRVDATAALENTGEVVVTLPPTGTLTLPAPEVPEEALAEGAVAPAGIAQFGGRYALEMEDAILNLTRDTTGASQGRAQLTATTITTTLEPETAEIGVAARDQSFTAFALDATFTSAPPGPNALDRLIMSAERMDFLSVERSDLGTRTADVQVTDYALTARLPRGDATGDRRVSLQTGFMAGTVATQPAPAGGATPVPAGGLGGKVDMSAETSAALLTVEDGQLTASTTIDEIGIRLTPDEETATIRGTGEIDRLDISVSQPVDDKAAAGAPLSMRVAAGILQLDETAWTALDPEGALPRGGAEFHAEMKGKMRPDVSGRAGWRGVETLRTSAFLTALDAEVETDLDIAFDPDGQPVGSGRVRLLNGMAVLRDLIAAGLITAEEAEVGFALAGQFMKPGEMPEELISELEIDQGFLMINGAPFLPLPMLPVPSFE